MHKHVGEALCWLKPDCVFFPVPNATTDLGRKLGGILKGQHKIYAGVSDWVFLWDTGAGVIELKVPPNTLSDDQEKFFLQCARRGVNRGVATSIDEVVHLLECWGRLPWGSIQRIRGITFPADKKIAPPRKRQGEVTAGG